MLEIASWQAEIDEISVVAPRERLLKIVDLERHEDRELTLDRLQHRLHRHAAQDRELDAWEKWKRLPRDVAPTAHVHASVAKARTACIEQSNDRLRTFAVSVEHEA